MVRGADNTAGEALIEIYIVSQPGGAHLLGAQRWKRSAGGDCVCGAREAKAHFAGKRMRVKFFLSALVVFFFGRLCAEPEVHYAAPSAWVVADAVKTLPPTPPGDVSYGYDYLLLDTQVSVVGQETYTHNIYRVTAEGSLQSAARLTLEFDPAYEELTMHHLRIIRDGREEDRLKGTPAKIIQQERELDRHLLNGELTALFVLDDIRVGDVVDYAYTRRGWNPVFAGGYFSRLQLAWSVPVRRQNFRLIVPASRLLGIQPHGNVLLAPAFSRSGNDVTATWTAVDQTPIHEEEGAPAWHEAFPWVQFTEFKTWSQVVRWAEPLYALPNPLPDLVRAQAEKLTRGLAGEEERAVALLQFVQQEIRYLGMELGAGSYRPTAPDIVLARRFGDCKDKALLFCALARAAGITAYPTLVHTTYRDKAASWLPTPVAFDHAIVALPVAGGGMRWVDPTLSHQQGGLAWRGLPNYGGGLILSPGNDRFTPIQPPATTRSSVKIEETFTVIDFDRPSTFQVRSILTGLSADSMRREFAETTADEIGKSYVNYYAPFYPGLTLLKPPRLIDDPGRNIVTVEESYSVPGLWKKDSGDGKLEAEFFPKTILDYAARPETPVRTTPLAIRHPTKAELTTTVNLPETWNIVPSEKIMESAGFRGTVSISGSGKVVVMKYGWSSRADHVEAERISQHVQALSEFRKELGYTLTYKPPSPVRTGVQYFRLNWMLVLVSLVTLTLTVLAVRRIHVRAAKPPPPILGAENPALTGIAGWLYLVAVGVTLSPVRLLFGVITGHRHSFDQNVWEAMTTPGSAAYQAGLGPLIVTEVVGNFILLSAAIWQVFLFYGRRRLFPGVYIAVVFFSLFLVVGDAVAASFIVTQAADKATNTYSEIGRAIGQAIIWIPYMLNSRRVKLTFTK